MRSTRHPLRQENTDVLILAKEGALNGIQRIVKADAACLQSPLLQPEYDNVASFKISQKYVIVNNKQLYASALVPQRKDMFYLTKPLKSRSYNTCLINFWRSAMHHHALSFFLYNKKAVLAVGSKFLNELGAEIFPLPPKKYLTISVGWKCLFLIQGKDAHRMYFDRPSLATCIIHVHLGCFINNCVVMESLSQISPL